MTTLPEVTSGKVEHMAHPTKDALKEAGVSLLDTLEHNPIPVAMVGVGLAWLLVSARRGPRTHSPRMRGSMQAPGEHRRYAGQGMYGVQGLDSPPHPAGAYGSGDQELYSAEEGDRIGRTAADRSDQAGAATEAVQRKVGEVTEPSRQLARRAQTSISRATQAAGARMSTIAHGVQDQGRRLESRVEETFHENPLLVGAAALAAGMLLGLAIPITRREDAWMGKTRDDLMQKAETVAQGALDKVQDAAKHIGEDSARGAGGNGNQPAVSTRNGTSGSPSAPR